MVDRGKKVDLQRAHNSKKISYRVRLIKKEKLSNVTIHGAFHALIYPGAGMIGLTQSFFSE